MDIIQIFKDWEKLSDKLAFTAQHYSMCFADMSVQEIREKHLNEKVSEKEKEDTIQKAAELEIEIDELYEKFLYHTSVVKRAIETLKTITKNLINTLNQYHISVVEGYSFFEKKLKRIEKDFEQPTSFIDLSKMLRQKQQLNVAIKNFNEKFQTDEDCKLLSTKECEEASD